VLWRYLGDGAADVDVAAQAVDTGPIVALSGDITAIETPVSGWKGVINIFDAEEGTDEETDPHLRIKREEELAGGGSTTEDEIRAALRKVPGVTAVTVFANPLGTTDADGVPGHAVECLVIGGEDQDIWDCLLANVADGIETWGTEEGTSTDSEGNEQTERFSRPEEVDIYVEMDVLVDPKLFPADGDVEIQSAITAFGDAQKTGKDAVASAIGAQAFSIPGVLDVTNVYIDTAPSPSTSDTIPISLRQLAVFDSSRITVNVTEGTP
jgi:uncharacterized phage protein gp47/JayE